MDGGRHALTGFTYQATVILDVLLTQFDNHPSTRARPEGDDDLELEWSENRVICRQFVQIKKPAEDEQGHYKLRSWTLGAIARALLPSAMKRLRGNNHTQRWILGDDVHSDVRDLVAAGADAPGRATQSYVDALNLIAREEAAVTEKLSKRKNRSLGHWYCKVDPQWTPEEAIHKMVIAFVSRLSASGVPKEKRDRFEDAVRAYHLELPDVLSRIRLESTFGHEEVIRRRVYQKLGQRYPISLSRIEHTIYRNCRAFVDDIANKKGMWITPADFDTLIHQVWPEMMLLREPPPLPLPHIAQRDIIEKVVARIPCRAVEVIGVSGSGKTTLARSVYDHVRQALRDVRVMYAEVRRGRSLREVLASVTFELNKLGFLEPWQAASSSKFTEEERVLQVAEALDLVPGKTLVLMDLVQGDCDDEFQRLLAAFLNGKPPERFTFVIFGQEPALAALTAFEKNNLGIPMPIEQRGFYFDEFVELCEHFQSSVDRERIWNVYHRITAGRVAGLLARLGYDLAQCASIEMMEQIVEGPADQLVKRTVRAKFDRIPDTLRGAAEKLSCQMLPFRLRDAMDIFPEDRIQAAADRLIERGLLNHHDAERLEMHETVRRCLEDEMPPAQKKVAHLALAEWYQRRGDIAAEIHHLDSAGNHAKANEKARAAFFSDERGLRLSDYIAKNKVISGAELANALLAGKPPEWAYIIPRLLAKLGDETTANMLLQGVLQQASRFDSDYKWAWWMTESILACAPERLYELALFGLATAHGANSEKGSERLERIAHGAGRAGVRVDQRLLALFDQENDPIIQWGLLDLLLVDRRREVLEKVLSFVSANERPQEGGRGSYVASRGPSISLRLRNRDENLAFLSAIPLPDTSQILMSQSPEFGRLTELIWALRWTLKPTCIEVIEAGGDDETTLENALRVLLLLRDERCPALAKPHRRRKSRFGNLCAIVPTMFSEVVDKTEYYTQLLDPAADINDRVADFAILTMLERDPWKVYARLEVADPAGARPFRFLALMHQTTLPPSEASIPVLEEFLKDCDDKKAMLWAPLLPKLGALPGDQAEGMLIHALTHKQAHVRMCALLSLQHRRCQRALRPLVNMVASEPHPQVAQSGLVAIVASGPAKMEELAPLWDGTEQRTLWRCIVAERLRAEVEAPFLVDTAVSPQNNWQLRRAAILAASRLPFDLALAKIIEPVMAERSPFMLDKNSALLGHSALSALLKHNFGNEGDRGLVAKFGLERVLGVWYDQFVENESVRNGTPSGAVAAKWVGEKLRAKPNATGEDLQRLIDGIHVPMLHAAVLRGLRMAGQRERIAEIIRTADTEWLLVRAMVEYAKCCIGDDIAATLEELLAKSRFPDSPYAKNVANKQRRATPQPVLPPSPPPKISTLTVPDVMAALSSRALSDKNLFIVACADEKEFQTLVDLLDPANDYTLELQSSEPRMSFVGGGVSVGGVNRQQRDNGAQIRKTLRPAIAAANRFQLSIPWHAKLLSERDYFKAFLEHLGAAGDAGRLYENLAQHDEIIFPQFDDSTLLNPILKLVDARMIPYLRRFAQIGTDGLMESLCSMARRIDDPAIDPVLSALFQRWHHRFDLRSKSVQHDENHPLWRSLSSLKSHPRFRLIPGYEDRLMELLHLPIRWFYRDNIVQILFDSPRGYARLECLLFKAAPFAHYYEDEVEQLDAAADKLFRSVD